MAEKYDVLAQKSAPLSSALGTDMPVIPTRKDGSPDYLSAYETFKKPQLAKTEGLYKEQSEFEALQREEGARQEGKLAAGKAENIRKQKKDIEESQTSKDLTTLEDQYMHAAFVPTQATMGEMAALFSLIGVTGMLIGAGSKGNSQAAMSAMSGMMKGYREGNEDLYKKEKATFDENLKVMSQRKEMLTRRLEQIAKLATMDKDAADEELTVLLAGEKADFYKAYKDKFGLPKLIELDKEVNKTYEKRFDFVVKEDERVREETRRRQEKLEDEKRRKQDKIEAEQRANAQRIIDEKRRFEEKKEFAEFAASLKSLKGQGGLGAKAFLESTLGVTAPDEKTSQKIVDTALGVSQLGHVMTIFKDPEVKAGVMSKLSSIKEKLASLGDNNYEISDSELRRIIDGEISSSAKNAVAQKEALFAAYTAEREIAGGRLLVSVVKQAGGALDPTNYEKAGFLNLLGNRREELVKRLRGARMNDEQINTVVQNIEGDAKSARSFSQSNVAGRSQQETVTVGGQTYTRPADWDDAKWNKYKQDIGVK
jgi:hypothetical protein